MSIKLENGINMYSFEERYQSRLTKIELRGKNKLHRKYNQIDKKFRKDLQNLNWQYSNCTRKISRLYSNVYKSPKISSCLTKCKDVILPTYTDKAINNIHKTKPESAEQHQIFNFFPRLPKNNGQQEQFSDLSYYDKIKIIVDNFKKIGISPDHMECLKTIDDLCQSRLHQNFYNSSFIDDMKMIIKNDLKNTELEKHLVPEKFKNKEKLEQKNKVQTENRVKFVTNNDDDTDLNKHVKLFQALLRGRAYQTMMNVAKIRYKPFLNAAEKSPTPVDLSSGSDVHKVQVIDTKDVLEFSTRRYISRFFDTIYKESIRKKHDYKNMLLNELGEEARVKKEAAEGHRRLKEVTGRNEQDEILKQVVKIHGEFSELFFERIMEEAIEQCAKEDGKQLMHTITSRNSSRKERFYNINTKNIEGELVHNFIIPKAYKITEMLSHGREY